MPAKPLTSAVNVGPGAAMSKSGAAASGAAIGSNTIPIALGAVAVATVLVVGITVGVLTSRHQSDPAPQLPPGVLRTYYLAAEETWWDYAPGYTNGGYDNCTGYLATLDHQGVFAASESQAAGEEGSIFGAIGSTYKRRVWRAYTDDTFTTRAAQDPSWAHAGFYGPVLRAAVGDTVRVVIKNRSRHPASFHAIGLRLVSVVHAADEDRAVQLVALNLTLPNLVLGAPGKAGLASASNTLLDPFSGGYRTVSPACPAGARCATPAQGAGGNANVTLDVAPGHSATLTWFVPTTAGPSPGQEQDTVPHLYQSLGYTTHDLSLSGILVVSRAGGNGRPADPTTSEHQIVLSVSDENSSPYLNTNILDRVLRPRYVAAHDAGDFAVLNAAAAQPESPVFPILGVSRGLLFAALYSAATGGEDEVDPTAADVVAATTSAGAITTFNGVHLGLTFLANSESLDATAFVAHYGQAAAEDAVAAVLAEELVFSSPDFDPAAFEESNLMHSLNGYIYCNAPDIHIRQGTTARWYSGVLGSEVDGHSLHWHGNVLTYGSGWRADSIPLLPRSFIAADMDAENVGKWLFHCHVTDHIHAGMIVLYHVMPALSGGAIQQDTFVSSSRAAVAAQALPVAAGGAAAPPIIAASLIGGTVRTYYIAAEYDESFNHTSSWGQELCESVPGAATPDDGVPHIAIPRIRYVAYGDPAFTTRLPVDPAWAHTGILGPVIRAVVGDTIRIVLLNRSPRAVSLHPHGVFYRKNGEGAPYKDGTSGLDKGDDSVVPGANWTYVWFVPPTAGPASEDVSSILWLYHGHVHETEDENVGLLGGILITKKGMERSPTDLRPKDVDREFLLIYKVFDPVPINASDLPAMHGGGGAHAHHRRLHSLHRSPSRSRALSGGGGAEEEEEYPHTFTLNGLSFCSLPPLEMDQGERVRYYLGSLGNEIDSTHFAAFGGHAVTWHGHTVVGVPLLAGTMQVADMVATVPGTWLLDNGSHELAKQGAQAVFIVRPTAAGAVKSGLTPAALAADETRAARTYFVSADEVEWSYVGGGGGGGASPAADFCVPSAGRSGNPAFTPESDPSARFDVDGTDLDAFPADARIFVRRDDKFLGATYTKAVYRGYTDGTFRNLTGRAAGGPDEHLGLLGPILRGAVGETVRIVFRHNLRSGVLPAVGLVPTSALVVTRVRRLNATTRAWQTLDLTPTEAHDYVATEVGEQLEYLVFIPPAAGPGPQDPSTIAWTYTSVHNPSEALYAGLVGPFLVARNAAALASPGVEREYVLASAISDENLSPYLEHNIHMRAVINASTIDREDEEFVESNLYHAINGKLYCGAAGFDANVGDRVRWHLLGFGGALDMHSPTFHGGMGLLHNGGWRSTLDMYPGQAASADMVADAPGSWLIECGLVDHFVAGMRAIFSVRGSASTPALSSSAASAAAAASVHSHRVLRA